MRTFLSFILFLIVALSGHARRWTTDILGAPFQQSTVTLPSDYAGNPVCTIVRALPADTSATRAVLYVHGYNDYFFQSHMACQFLAHGYAFFAVDLRRYGRSLRAADTPFDIRDINAYSAEIDSALSIMKAEGFHSIVLMGHSTGGLITASYLSHHHPADVKALILNSPFLDWNLGDTEKIVPAVSLLGKILPSVKIPQGHSTAYAESLLKSAHGEWDYDTTKKHIQSLPVTAGWIRAIDNAQRDLRKTAGSIKVPVLLTMSSSSVSGSQWTPEFNRADAVLDVNDIYHYGRNLSSSTTILRFRGGLHDLTLSSCPVRCAYFRAIFTWLSTVLSQ